MKVFPTVRWIAFALGVCSEKAHYLVDVKKSGVQVILFPGRRAVYGRKCNGSLYVWLHAAEL